LYNLTSTIAAGRYAHYLIPIALEHPAQLTDEDQLIFDYEDILVHIANIEIFRADCLNTAKVDNKSLDPDNRKKAVPVRVRNRRYFVGSL